MRHPPSENAITRRRLLKAAGFSIGLPALLSIGEHSFLQPVRGEDPDASRNPNRAEPKRFCCIFFPNGVSLPPKEHAAHKQWHWFPHDTGDDYEFTSSIQPLEKHRDQLTILSGLSHPAMRGSIAHITADSFLTGADSSQYYTNSISLDQLIARQIGDQTRFPSLTLSSDGGVGTPGRTQTLSFTAAGRPIPSLSNPRAIFNRLFGVTDRSLEQQRKAFGRDRSILDHVLEETRAIGASLSASDRRRLDEYAESVREIERRLDSADKWLDSQQPNVEAGDFNLTVTSADNAEDYIRSILDLMHVAILTDSTRTITYQVTSEDAKGIGDRFPNSIGLPNHHQLSHGIASAAGYEQWGRYDRFLSKQLAYFIDKLHRTDDPVQPGSLLENTLVYYGCSTSRTHEATNYPLVLAGGQSMRFRHGNFRRFDQDEHRLSDLYVTMLQQLGVETDRFADSAGTLPEVLS